MHRQVKQFSEQDEDKAQTLRSLGWLFRQTHKRPRYDDQTDAIIDAIVDVASAYQQRRDAPTAGGRK